MTATEFTSSPFIGGVEAITESDEELARILEHAELPPLLPALAYCTGDLTLLRDHLRPNPMLAQMPQGGLSDDQAREIRALALEKLIAFRDGGCVPAPVPSDDDVLRIMEFAVSGEGMGEYLPLLEEELGHLGRDARGPSFVASDVAPGVDFSVAVIGAGMSGLLAGHRLQQAGISFTIYEKNADVGGTWLENSYPGCRVDNPNHNYSYSFAQRHDWPFHFSPQPVLRDYFSSCCDAFGLRPSIRFGVEVESATWSESDLAWTLSLSTGETVVANAVISAVGQLNRPNYPDIPGRSTFAGPSFHSARWDHSVELEGKRVVVIGTGASAVQFIPEIEPVVGSMSVFQRTPPWLAPVPTYHAAVAPELSWLYGHVPSYSEWTRFCIFWRMGDGAIAGVRVDPSWWADPSHGQRSVSAANDLMRAVLEAYLQSQFSGRPDLLASAVPNYPPGAKRMILDNGVWARALSSERVTVVTNEISSICADGVVDGDGVLHEADVLIYGTGFQASNFLTPMKVTGRDGVDLHESWAGDARAYLGVTIPGFPNLFCLYGPNTNIVINGSIVYFSECGVRYVLGCLELALRAGGGGAVEVRRSVHDEFNAAVDAENSLMAWGASSVSSWYKNAHGHVAQNWPFTLLEYWQRTLAPDPSEYEVLARPS